MHRRFLVAPRIELERLRVDDISQPQGLIPTKIEDRDVSVRDIVERGYYLGSNVSYNIGQIVQSGYVTQDGDGTNRIRQRNAPPAGARIERRPGLRGRPRDSVTRYRRISRRRQAARLHVGTIRTTIAAEHSCCHGDPRMGDKGIGASLARKEDDRYMRGRGEFVGDIRLDRMVEAAFVRSPVAHGRIRAIRKPDGAGDNVFTAADLAGVRPVRAISTSPAYKPSDWHALALDKVRFVGECVAVCIAESRARAEDLARRVELDIDDQTGSGLGLVVFL